MFRGWVWIFYITLLVRFFMVKFYSYIDVVIITDSYFYFLVNGAVSMMCMGTFLGSLQHTQLHP